ncbi:MAG: Na+/H+ antiporter NhaA [Bacteroidetes bacterium CG18_big_fil_WC_8_21_14_2_50_41_14]|nr:MAG: Na+/H+ antiporter NhaA [Bacteroidetes bacterium CG18_big_fil_WC_8_21_14_2_50_41_14]PJB58280.1 MAG: Na+/H+ antiporter NhaA [Bacteroidetes bacterium CG_4_9_14_3_um_filter_41_19]
MDKPPQTYGIRRYINEESIGGIILILSTLSALIWANSGWYDSYHFLWHDLQAGFGIGDFKMVSSLGHWINDGLMALFFFTVGLEIKREIMGGELSSLKKASLPIFAALGGMLLPAGFYAITVSSYPEFLHGWGIPMATDIAFALGLLALLGKRININLKIFLTALAIADDLGAVLVIAIFYTEAIDYTELLTAAFFLGVLIVANIAGVRRTIFYALVGFIGVWIAFMLSGVHATIAGVLIALTIPARTKISENQYVARLFALTKKFEKEPVTDHVLLSENQVHLLTEIEELNDKAHTPLQKLEHAMHPLTTYFILPLFALSNAGVHVEGSVLDLVFHPISLGIVAGLLLGKFLGISLFSLLAVRLGWASLPEGVSWLQVVGVAMLAGIGFTMSMFIADLAFVPEDYKQIAKVGIMTASMVAAFAGMCLLIYATRTKATKE